ncbi:DNA-directed RNA polymerase I subunit RPA34 [Brachyhypopomus gauderio]|uniref:DNA-directed RNA polymerase I subunit RPA34 n=1 Tax=Brachyhypopomus gauderio TaxID=698409 RepID=UPI004042CD0C
MSHAVSSNEDHPETSQKSQDQHQRASNYECPVDFVSFEYNSSKLSDSDEHELWLIKAPSRFDPKILKDLELPLSGLKTIEASGGTPQHYSVLGSCTAPTEVQILTCSHKNRDTLSASNFTGILSISESYGSCVGRQSLFSVPTAPVPSVPPGLRQRFQPFGSSTAGATPSDSPSPLKRSKRKSDGCGEQRKKKKKKKAEKHGEEENHEVLEVKQEQMSYDFGEMQVPEAAGEDGTAERRKKKKKKKDKEKQAEDCSDEVAFDANLIAKQEPMDTSYGDVDSPVKKKKKKKKHVDE